MEKTSGFWKSLDSYMGKVAEKFPLPYVWVGIGLALLSAVSSLTQAKNSVVGARSEREIVERAVRVGDYQLAQELFDHYTNGPLNQMVLGASAELEERVYPERVVEKRIAEMETKLQEYPGHRDILLEIARLYGEIGDPVKAQDYWEQARILDPNNPVFVGE